MYKMKKVFILVLMTSLVITMNAQVIKTLKTEKDGFRWYELKENGVEGAQDVNGYSLIPLTKGYDRVYYFNGYFNVIKNRYAGLYSAEGKEIISTERGYENVLYFNGYIVVQKDQSYGICNIEGKEIIPTSRGYKVIIPQGEPNNYPYFQVWKSNNQGVCDIDGNEIIPPNEEYSSKSYYIKEINAFGCCEKHASTGVKIDRQGHAINYLDKDGNVKPFHSRSSSTSSWSLRYGETYFYRNDKDGNDYIAVRFFTDHIETFEFDVSKQSVSFVRQNADNLFNKKGLTAPIKNDESTAVKVYKRTYDGYFLGGFIDYKFTDNYKKLVYENLDIDWEESETKNYSLID